MGNTLDLMQPISISWKIPPMKFDESKSKYLYSLDEKIRKGDFARDIVGFEGWSRVKGPNVDPEHHRVYVTVLYDIPRTINKSNYLSFLRTRMGRLTDVETIIVE